MDEVSSSGMLLLQEEETMDDLLFSRITTDSILVEKQSSGAPSPFRYCWLCEEKISVPYYYYTSSKDEGGGETKTLFVHKVCFNLPVEMEHENHRGHTLRSLRRPAGGGSLWNVCSTCKEYGYVFYKCSECEEFVLDIRCALKSFPIHHKNHPHPLIPIHKSEVFHCVACNEVDYGISYLCTACSPSFRVHQDCVSLRKKMKMMDNNLCFSSDADWILEEEEEEEEESSVKEIYCWLCKEKISVPYYYYTSNQEEEEEDGGETEVQIFLHQVCFDLPVELEHQLHRRGHTLRRTRGSYQVCSCCYQLGNHIYYKCSDCEDAFVLDIRCALKLFPIRKIYHPHPLIPIHNSEYFDCVACNKFHYGISYICTACPSFRVHQNCGSLSTFKLPAHRHGLEILYSIPQSHYGEPVYCQLCRQGFKEEETLAYHCASCRYFFHSYDCRSITHFSQPDPLVLIEEEGAHAEAASANCDACGLKISVPYYCRIWGKAFLHKFCAELPQSVEHHLHPGHDLTLQKSNHVMCDACHEPWEGGFSYCCPCASCRFIIDIICALKNIQKHKFHEHPLISSHTKAPFACRACNRDSDGPSHQCTTCRFWVHQECASLPMSRKHVAHPHVLKLIYSLGNSSDKYRCHVCREEIQHHNWAYHCAGCKYYTHVHDCSKPPWTRAIVDFDYKAALAAAIHLPAVDDKMATMFFMETNNRDALFLDPNETCDRCAEFLAAPCNNCALCNYFLPKSHAELVDDPLSLLNGYNSMLKDTKDDDDCNGFGMLFHEDSLEMRISCSVLPRYVKHEGHRHVLLTTFITNPTWCSACENNVRGYAFRCNICDFTIDTYCALLPRCIRHRYDKKHPFKLTYYSVEDVEEYVCEICEGDITTMWFFHCEECDHSIHSRCIWKLHIQFGPFVNHADSSWRENDFTLVPTSKAQHPFECNHCEQKEISGYHISLFQDTPGCLFSLFGDNFVGNYIMTHLQCMTELKMERWPTDREDLLAFLAILRTGEDISNFSNHVRYVYESWRQKTLKRVKKCTLAGA